MKKKNIKRTEEMLDERFSIIESFNYQPDINYYAGMIEVIEFLGLSMERDEYGKHKIF